VSGDIPMRYPTQSRTDSRQPKSASEDAALPPMRKQKHPTWAGPKDWDKRPDVCEFRAAQTFQPAVPMRIQIQRNIVELEEMANNSVDKTGRSAFLQMTRQALLHYKKDMLPEHRPVVRAGLKWFTCLHRHASGKNHGFKRCNDTWSCTHCNANLQRVRLYRCLTRGSSFSWVKQTDFYHFILTIETGPGHLLEERIAFLERGLKVLTQKLDRRIEKFNVRGVETSGAGRIIAIHPGALPEAGAGNCAHIHAHILLAEPRRFPPNFMPIKETITQVWESYTGEHGCARFEPIKDDQSLTQGVRRVFTYLFHLWGITDPKLVLALKKCLPEHLFRTSGCFRGRLSRIRM